MNTKNATTNDSTAASTAAYSSRSKSRTLSSITQQEAPVSRPANPPGWTTQAGLGYLHQQARIQALALLRDGIDVCPYCHRPMNRRQKLDLDDYPARRICELLAAQHGRVITPVKRLSHARCNRAAGARLLAILRKHGLTRPQRRTRTPVARSTTTRRSW